MFIAYKGRKQSGIGLAFYAMIQSNQIMNVYLDNNATTNPLIQVVEAMMSGLTDGFANPPSPHQLGLFARMKVEQARESVAQLIGCRVPSDIIFTSGGTGSISQVFAIAYVQAEKTINCM